MPRKRRTWTKKRKTKKVEKWYTIRSIVDERTNNKGDVEFLVDWEDDPETGEVYENSWTISAWVTPEAKSEWEAHKARKTETEEPAGPSSPTIFQQIGVPVHEVGQQATSAATEPAVECATEAPDESEDSQPPRPANWRHLYQVQPLSRSLDKRRVDPDEFEEDLPAKKSRRDYDPSPSQEPAPSITSSASFPSATSYDLLDEAFPPAFGSSRLALTVELNQPDFDVSEYHSVQATQSSLYSSQAVSELEAEDKRIAFGPDTSQKTIPDSQETSDPSLSGGATQSSSHSAPQHTVPDSQSQLVSHRGFIEATNTSGQPESTLSSRPECVPSSKGNFIDIPSRQPIHQLDLHELPAHASLKQAETGGATVQQLAPSLQSQELSLSHELDLAVREASSPTEDSGKQDCGPSPEPDVPQLVCQDCSQHISGRANGLEILASSSDALIDCAQAQSGFIGNETCPEGPEFGYSETTSPDHQAQQETQPDGAELYGAITRDFARETERISTDPQKPGFEHQASAELGPVPPPDSTAFKLAEEAASAGDSSKDFEIVTGEAPEPLSTSEDENTAQLARSKSGGCIRTAQGKRTDTPEEELVSESRKSVEQDRLAIHDHRRESSSESRGVAQALFLTQPEFPEIHSRSSSSRQQSCNTSTPLRHHPEVGFKDRAPKRVLPEYSPGILLSLCEDSRDYSSTMLGSEGEETPVTRSSAISGMRAIWDDEPAVGEKKAGIRGNDPPMTEPMGSPSACHSVAIAGPSTGGFLSQLSEPSVSWVANESSGLVDQGVVPSAAVAGMRKLLNSDYLEMPDAQPVTVSPADVSLPSEAERLTLPVLPSHDATLSSYSSSGQYVLADQLPQLDKEVSSPLESETVESYLVTLPFPSNLRQRYYSTITKYQAEAAAFVDLFTSENLIEPEPALTAAITNLFAVLRNFCDYPESALDLQNVPVDQQVKYYMDASAKFNFLYELLQAITQDTKILIVARSLNILRMICNIAESLHLDITCEALKHSVASHASHVRLTLSLHTGSADPWQHDVVISYDSVSSDSDMMKQLTAGSMREHQLLVLRLAIAFTIEHIEAEIPPPDIPLMRKPTVLNATVNARYLVLNPPRLPKPHEIATMFSEYINRTTESLVWEPELLPAAVVDIYATQTATQMQREISVDSEAAGRKRKPDVAMDADTKRLRVESQIDIPPLSDSVQSVLREVGFVNVDAATTPKERQLGIPLEVMEALAHKYLENQRAAASAEELEPRYRQQINNLQRQVKDYEETQDVTYRRVREAVADRTQFEANAQKAEAALNQANEAADANREKAHTKIKELEAVVARLSQDSALSANEKLLGAAHQKIQMLEKRLETSHSTEAYTRDLYQQVSNSVHATNRECERLRERNAELEKMASENMVMAQQEQSKSSAKAYLVKISELETSLREAQIELDRTREENRNYRNGRRETRQVSVPCSPRVGSLMSPRPRATFGGAASRAASPAPVMGAFDGGPASSQFSTPSGSSRFIRRP